MMIKDNHSLLDIYAHEIEKYPLMTKAQKDALKDKKNEDLTDEEKDQLVTSNLRFVISEAKKFINKNKHLHGKVDLMDLIQAGNIGLVDSLKKFDPSTGYCFITFARHDIYNRFLKSVSQYSVGNNIKVPSNSRQNRKMVFTSIENFKSKHNREPTEKEMCSMLNMKLSGYL
jgi:RNA polymerase primary sigma factor